MSGMTKKHRELLDKVLGKDPRVDRIIAKRDQAIEMWRSLTPEVVAELYRRAEHPVNDAYSSGDAFAGGGRWSKGDHGDPVFAKVLAQLEGSDPHDPTLGLIQQVWAGVSEAHGSTRQWHRTMVAVLLVAERLRGRPAEGTDCVACTRHVGGGDFDPNRAGMCRECSEVFAEQREELLVRCHGDLGQARLLFCRERPPWQEPRSEKAS